MMTRRLLVAGNWKMNGLMSDGREFIDKIKKISSDVDILICPPATLIDFMVKVTKGSKLSIGGQDCHFEKSGAYTGDISASMLKDLGASHVIVGHSERRANYKEINKVVRAKATMVNIIGLVAIICLGETEAERDNGKMLTVIETQFLESLPEIATSDNTIIAYEPVWAIGTGRTPSVTEVAEAHRKIRELAEKKLGLNVAKRLRIIYGGSVNQSNARELFAIEDVDGGLVGGASLKAENFSSIIEAGTF
ncbi:MAG: triose-phosphate isomerase [Rhodospirillaceae bacterium]|nr:triose-phosphate isomerase [Rhodospirillaceae bacterium]